MNQQIQEKTKQVIQRFKEVHGQLYDYSKVTYYSAITKVRIICQIHGEFTQEPRAHQSGQGCPRCSGNYHKNTQEQVLDFQKVHEDLYDYTNVVYQNNATDVEIICKIHGIFKQTPHNHLKGQGCPDCQGKSYKTLYIMRCANTNLIKIGITNNLYNRKRSIGGRVEVVFYMDTNNPRDIETQLHRKYAQYRDINPTVNNGNTEFFRLDDLQVQEVINFLKQLD